MIELFANSRDPDQTASDLGMQCFPIASLGVSSLHVVNSVLLALNFALSSNAVPCYKFMLGPHKGPIHFYLV